MTHQRFFLSMPKTCSSRSGVTFFALLFLSGILLSGCGPQNAETLLSAQNIRPLDAFTLSSSRLEGSDLSPITAAKARRLADLQAREWSHPAFLLEIQQLGLLGRVESSFKPMQFYPTAWLFVYRDSRSEQLLVVVMSSEGIVAVGETAIDPKRLTNWPVIRSWRKGVRNLSGPENAFRRLVALNNGRRTPVWIQGRILFNADTGEEIAGDERSSAREEIESRLQLLSGYEVKLYQAVGFE